MSIAHQDRGNESYLLVLATANVEIVEICICAKDTYSTVNPWPSLTTHICLSSNAPLIDEISKPNKPPPIVTVSRLSIKRKMRLVNLPKVAKVQRKYTLYIFIILLANF